MGGYEIASSNGNGNVLSTIRRTLLNSGTTGATIFQVRDQATITKLYVCVHNQGAIQVIECS